MFLDFLFPKTCLECKKEGGYICDACLALLQPVKAVCPECLRPSIDGATHAKCQRKLGLDGLTALYPYTGVVRKAILALKYKYATEIAQELAGAVYLRLKSQDLKLPAGVLIPVSLHWRRENFRGFNQTEEIGKSLSKGLGLRFIPDLLIRKKFTTPQAKLDKEERAKNIRNSFIFNPQYSTFRIPHSLVIFDDVYTTGSTLREAAKVLKRAGFKNVWGLTIAR